MPSLYRPQLPFGGVTLTVAVALAAFVGADQLTHRHSVFLGFSLDVAHVRVSLEAEVGDIKGE